MLRAIAIDDEPVALEVIKKHSAKISFIELIAVFTHASRAIEFLKNEKVDLLFLDIMMPGISGIDLLKSIPDPAMVIFTTAYPEHAVQSFELNAIDYLLKPFSEDRFMAACQKAHEQYELRNTFHMSLSGPLSVFVKSGYEQMRILLDEILYIEASGSYVQFVLHKQKILSRLSMNEVEDLLPRAFFVRVHRSFIVSVKQISRIEKNAVWIGQTTVPVSATFTDALQRLSGKQQ